MNSHLYEHMEEFQNNFHNENDEPIVIIQRRGRVLCNYNNINEMDHDNEIENHTTTTQPNDTNVFHKDRKHKSSINTVHNNHDTVSTPSPENNKRMNDPIIIKFYDRTREKVNDILSKQPIMYSTIVGVMLLSLFMNGLINDHSSFFLFAYVPWYEIYLFLLGILTAVILLNISDTTTLKGGGSLLVVRNEVHVPSNDEYRNIIQDRRKEISNLLGTIGISKLLNMNHYECCIHNSTNDDNNNRNNKDLQIQCVVVLEDLIRLLEVHIPFLFVIDHAIETLQNGVRIQFGFNSSSNNNKSTMNGIQKRQIYRMERIKINQWKQQQGSVRSKHIHPLRLNTIRKMIYNILQRQIIMLSQIHQKYQMLDSPNSTLDLDILQQSDFCCDDDEEEVVVITIMMLCSMKKCVVDTLYNIVTSTITNGIYNHGDNSSIEHFNQIITTTTESQEQLQAATHWWYDTECDNDNVSLSTTSNNNGGDDDHTMTLLRKKVDEIQKPFDMIRVSLLGCHEVLNTVHKNDTANGETKLDDRFKSLSPWWDALKLHTNSLQQCINHGEELLQDPLKHITNLDNDPDISVNATTKQCSNYQRNEDSINTTVSEQDIHKLEKPTIQGNKTFVFSGSGNSTSQTRRTMLETSQSHLHWKSVHAELQVIEELNHHIKTMGVFEEIEMNQSSSLDNNTNNNNNSSSSSSSTYPSFTGSTNEPSSSFVCNPKFVIENKSIATSTCTHIFDNQIVDDLKRALVGITGSDKEEDFVGDM